MSRTHPTDTHLQSDPRTARDVTDHGLPLPPPHSAHRLRATWEGQ